MCFCARSTVKKQYIHQAAMTVVMTIQRLLLRRVTSLVDVIRRGCVNSRHNVNNNGGDFSPSYVHGTSSLPLIGATIGQLLHQRAELTPDKEAYVACHQNARLTFQQLLQQVKSILPVLISHRCYIYWCWFCHRHRSDGTPVSIDWLKIASILLHFKSRIISSVA